MTKKKLFAPLFIAASFLLVGCSTDTIVGRPSWIKDPIVNGEGLKDNKMKDIYDAIKELGDTNSNVLNKVMYQIAQNQLGSFEDLKALAKTTATNEEIKAFVEKYPAYKSEDQGYVKGAEELQDLEDSEKIAVSRAKIKAQYDAIINRVCELMYNEVKDGSYTTDGVKKLFSEKEYIRHLKKELYHPVGEVTENGKQVFTPKPIGTEWKDFVNNTTNKSGYLHIITGTGDNEEFTEFYYPKTADGEDHGYIGRKILPDIYRELLIENYVREQRYTNLGRGYARNIEMIKITSADYKGKVSDMLTYYAKKHITGDGTKTGKATEGSLDILSEAMVGIADIEETIGSDTPRDYLENGGHFQKMMLSNNQPIKWKTKVNIYGEPAKDDGSDAVTTYVYHGTKLGDLVEKYKKAFDLVPTTITTAVPNFEAKRRFPLTDEAQSAYNEFTNNGAYPVEVGIELKERELFSTDLTQDGWFLKSGGLTDITDKFRNPLFNIGTSLIVDDESKMEDDPLHPESGWGSYKSGDSSRYFEAVKESKSTEHAYIVNSTIGVDNPWDSVVLEDGENFFIIKVNEATSLAKLSTDDVRSYLRLKATTTVTDSNVAMNKAIRGIVKPVASGDTYKKNAEQYYLMISNILFYDQSVYDYFKSQFPELFK